MSHDVFISHSSQDKSVADAACAKLEARNIRCWMAPRDILPGIDWGEAIIDAISGAKVMVLIFSNHSNTSGQVKREVQNAVGEGTAVLPFRIDDATPIKSLRYFLGTQHWLDAITPPLEKHLEHLSDTVSALLARASDTPAAIKPSTQEDTPGQPIEKQGDGAILSSPQTAENLLRTIAVFAWADGQLTHEEETLLLAKASDLGLTEVRARQIIAKCGPSDSPATPSAQTPRDSLDSSPRELFEPAELFEDAPSSNDQTDSSREPLDEFHCSRCGPVTSPAMIRETPHCPKCGVALDKNLSETNEDVLLNCQSCGSRSVNQIGKETFCLNCGRLVSN